MNIVFDWVSQDALRAIFAAGGKFGNLKHGYRTLLFPEGTTYKSGLEFSDSFTRITLPTGVVLTTLLTLRKHRLVPIDDAEFFLARARELKQAA